jgi:drug/metabolite transporter (DMT)-like permease
VLRSSAWYGLGMALLSAATFSTSGSFSRALTDAGWSPGAEVLIRVAVATVVLAVPAALSLRGRWAALWRNRWLVGGFGLLAIGVPQACYFYALRTLSVGVALLLEYMGILLVVVFMWARYGQRPRRLTVAGSVVALGGLVLVLDVLGGAHLDVVGVLWGLGAACGLAAYFVLASREDPELPPRAMASAGMAAGAVVLALLGLARILPLHATYGTVHFGAHRTSWLVPVLGLSVIAAAVAYVTGVIGTRALGARLASFVGLTEVLFAVLVAWLLLGQLPTGAQLAGGVLIIAGVALVRAAELGPAAVPDQPTGRDAVVEPAG